MKIPNLREFKWFSPPDLGGENISSIMRRYMEWFGWHNGDNPALIYAGSESQLEKAIEAKKEYLHIPLIMNFWGWMPERFMNKEWQQHYAKKLELIQEYADIITVPSSKGLEQLRMLGITKPIEIKPPGVDTISLLASKADSTKYVSQGTFILSIGRLVQHKNFQMVIDALSDSGYRYVIIGNGEYKETLIRLAKEKNVNLVIYENLDDAKKNEMVALARIIIVPSLYEGFGLPIVESISLGVPVLATNLPVFSDLFGDNLEYFRNIEELKDKIKYIIENDNYRKEVITKEALLALKYSALQQSISLNALFIETITTTLKNILRLEYDKGNNTLAEVYNFDAELDKQFFGYRLDPNTPLFFFRADPLLSNIAGKNVLDVGSSTGIFALYMAHAGFDVTCIDIAEEYLKIVNALAEKNNLRNKITTLQCDATKLEGIFKAESFDNIWAGEIIEHFKDSTILIQQLMRVLKTNGRLLLTLPYQSACHDPFHMKEFINEEDIKAIFKEFPKFEFKEIKKIGSPGGKHNNWFAWGIKNV